MSRCTVWNIITISVIIGLTALAAQPQRSLAIDAGVLSSAAVSRAGLTVEWTTQISAGATGRIVDVQLNVNENRSTTYFLLRYGKKLEIVSERDLDAFGNPYGVQGAEERIKVRQEIVQAELIAAGREKTEINTDQYVLPESTLYTLTSDGLVTAIDADTGQTKWSLAVGDVRIPSIGLGASNDHVAAVAGASVYCIDATNGKVMWKQRCQHAVGAGPAVSEEYVYVPLVNGTLEAFPIASNGIGSTPIVSVGHGVTRPLITDQTVSWPTDRGIYNVAKREGRRGAIEYRLKSSDSVVAPGSYQAGLLFVASLDGFVYALDEKTGSVVWEYSAGKQIAESPIPVGNFVYVVSKDKKMHKVDAQTGQVIKGWEEPVAGITKFIGASKQQLYVADQYGRLLVLEPSTGRRIATIPATNLNLILPNWQSDRLYVGSQGGLIQCLREVGSPVPQFHAGEFEPKAEPGPGDAEDKAQDAADDPFKGFDTDKDKDKMDDDPFAGGSDDPFAAGDDDKKAADDDPFAGGGDAKSADDDPFAGGGDEKEKADEAPAGGDQDDPDEDPFGGGGGDDKGGGDDPFGGGGS